MTNKQVIGFYFLLVVIFFSCQKETIYSTIGPPIIKDTTKVDFRDKFVGTYNCWRLCTFFTMTQPGIDTTFNSGVTINVIKDPNSSSLIIENDTVLVDSMGNYTGYYNPPAYKNYSVSFFNDSIHVSTYSGGLGGGTTCNTKGGK
jgi:hypothetical protein